MIADRITIHGVEVFGVQIDGQSGCAHYRSHLDIIAIRHFCCDQWFACISCHAELAGHASTVWPREKYHEKAVLCARCGHQATIAAYLNEPTRCASCGAPFNPGCVSHHHLYFEQPTRD